ncbi:MAG TPA: 3'(2'),5'-bisphosphate nucleotidase CysQ [Candidatus Binatia bacterium]|nr:3'(2'),5'-bisphosphate nucleotidase CysQ [Candidatus Binatia bacterium]
MNHSYKPEMDLAEQAAREAGAIVMNLFRGKFDVQEKGKNNPVTTADLEANRKIREIVRSRFSDDGWLSEEDLDTSRRLSSSRAWIVDPIDGTKEFIQGVAQFAVSIGFVVAGHPKVAVVYNPAKNRLYRAAAGQGAYLNDQAIRVSPRTDINGALLLVSRSEPQRKFQVFMDRCRIKPVGSIAYRLAKIAGGDGDGTLTFRSIHDWDVCGGMLIVEEAGGRVFDASGNPLIFNRPETRHRGIIAANPSLADDLQQLVARVMWEK